MTGSSRRRFTIWHSALLLPWAIASYGLSRSFSDNSYLWHIRAGDLQIDQGRVLTEDPFSFTMLGEPWRTQSWLAELLYSRLDEAWGLDGSGVLTTLCAVVLFVLVGLIAYRNSRSLLSVVVFLVATAVVMMGFFNPRPVIFSYPLFAGVVLAAGDRRLRWSIPVLMWIWAAVHGSFFIGLAFVALYDLSTGFDRRKLLEWATIGLPTLFTAHGLGVFEILLEFVQNREAVRMMGEWASPKLLSLPFLPLFLAILALVWLAQKGRIRPKDWFLLVPFLALAVSANRSVPPAWIALTPILSQVRFPVRQSTAGGLLPIALAVALGVVPLLANREDDVDLARFPTEAAQHLSQDRVFHDDATGGWLIYQQWPDRLVYIDDRAELFGDRMRTFGEVRNAGAEWNDEFNRWGIGEVLLRADEPLRQLLKAQGWTQEFADEHFVVMRR